MKANRKRDCPGVQIPDWTNLFTLLILTFGLADLVRFMPLSFELVLAIMATNNMFQRNNKLQTKVLLSPH
jgi:hypothetical protein